jgi:thymidylate synthase ThyX
MSTKQEIEELRRIMGTLPDQHPEKKTAFYVGVSGMKDAVKLIDWPHNPYKAMFTMATSCWGKKIDKWDDTTPQGRFMVVLAVLKRQALPLAYEAPSFTFSVERLPRWSFDQIARARQGIVFSSQGTRDNNHEDAGFFVHDEIAEDPELFEIFKKAALQCKDVYSTIVGKGKGSWQSARSIFPISNTHAFSFAANFAALQNLLSRRMQFCEADATVAFAWLVQKELGKKFPLLADFCRPGCDFAKKCTYNNAYNMSNMFGCLFAPCGRNKGETSEYAEFNNSCTDKSKLELQLGIHIKDPTEWINFTESDYSKLEASDQKLFEQED